MEMSADIISQTSSINNISKSISTTRSSLSSTSSSINRIQKIISTKTKVRNDLFFKNQILEKRRLEATKRRDLEDQIEASKVSTNIQSGLKVASSSGQGPLGRILSFLGYLGAGWIIENLPTWIAMGKEFIIRMKKAGEIIFSIPNTMWRILQNFGGLLKSTGDNIKNLDFTDSSNNIRDSFTELTNTVDLLGFQISEGFKLMLKPSGEVDIPSTGEQQPDTDFPEVPAPYPGGGTPGQGGKLQPIHRQALDIISGPESGGDYNAMNNGRAGDRPGGSKKWLGKNLTDMTIGEVKNYQNVKETLWAAGRYQIIPTSLPTAQSAAGLKDNDMFDKNNQDLLAIGLLKVQGPGAWSKYSKYSKEEISIMYKAKDTPLGKSVPSSPPPKSTITPQTPLSTSFAQVTGTSGNSQGNKPLSVPYSPFKPGSGATITSGKGLRNGRQHTGYDLAASPGTPLYAYFPGKVTHIGLDGTSSSAGYGNWVVWKDDIYGAYHFFGHMKGRPPVNVGQPVNQGTLMGNVGSTGRSTGPHLHWEISNNPPQSNGQFTSYEDPGSWLRKHPLKKVDSQPNIVSPSSIQTQPQIQEIKPELQPQPQISSPITEKNIVPERIGQQILFIDNKSPEQQSISTPPSKSYGGDVSGQITEFDMLNNFMKQKLLLDFNYL